jgi:biotin transport system substrate-specific component
MITTYNHINSYRGEIILMLKLQKETLAWNSNASIPIRLATILLGAALIGLAAQVKIPLPWTPVPITGQTFAVLLTGVLWGAQGGTLAVTAYLLLGWMGVPFFAGTTGLAGPTAGYLIGFIPAAYFTGILYNRFAWTKRLTGLLLIMTLANFIFIHGTGLIWLGCITGISDITKLLTLGTLPFLSGDLIKITAAAAIARSFTTRK